MTSFKHIQEGCILFIKSRTFFMSGCELLAIPLYNAIHQIVISEYFPAQLYPFLLLPGSFCMCFSFYFYFIYFPLLSFFNIFFLLPSLILFPISLHLLVLFFLAWKNFSCSFRHYLVL